MFGAASRSKVGRIGPFSRSLVRAAGDDGVMFDSGACALEVILSSSLRFIGAGATTLENSSK